jgi:hypothetical protein
MTQGQRIESLSFSERHKIAKKKKKKAMKRFSTSLIIGNANENHKQTPFHKVCDGYMTTTKDRQYQVLERIWRNALLVGRQDGTALWKTDCSSKC